MGRCLSCNEKLNDFEMTRKYKESGKFVDLCNSCFNTIPDFPSTITRPDLYYEETIDSEEVE